LAVAVAIVEGFLTCVLETESDPENVLVVVIETLPLMTVTINSKYCHKKKIEFEISILITSRSLMRLRSESHLIE
jgi:hypothetical protein